MAGLTVWSKRFGRARGRGRERRDIPRRGASLLDRSCDGGPEHRANRIADTTSSEEHRSAPRSVFEPAHAPSRDQDRFGGRVTSPRACRARCTLCNVHACRIEHCADDGETHVSGEPVGIRCISYRTLEASFLAKACSMNSLSTPLMNLSGCSRYAARIAASRLAAICSRPKDSTHPRPKRFRAATDLLGDRTHRRPLRRVRTLLASGENRGDSDMALILSRIGAS